MDTLEPLAAEAARLIRDRVDPFTREVLLDPAALEGAEWLLIGIAVLAARGAVDAAFVSTISQAARLLGRALARLDLVYASGAIGEREYHCLGHRLLSFLNRGAGEREALLLAAERTREATRLGLSLVCTAARLGKDLCSYAGPLRALAETPAVKAGGLVDPDAAECLRFLEEAVEAVLAACSGKTEEVMRLCSSESCSG